MTTQVQHVLQEQQVNLSAELESPVRLDVRVTAMVLAHMVENAAQCSPAGSSIHVVVPEMDEQLVIQVRGSWTTPLRCRPFGDPQAQSGMRVTRCSAL
jgi:K+-sensing histidine kinase KdpD